MLNENHSEKNMKAVLGSVVVAKAMLRREDGRIEHIVVFQESTQFEFYWVFVAEDGRTPRKAWKYANHWKRDFGMDSPTPRDFGEFVDHYTRTKQAEVQTVRVFHPKRMADLLTKTNHSSIYTDWTPQDMSVATFDKVQARTARASQPPGYYFNNRDRAADDAVFQGKDEVLVYKDFCEECGQKHPFAHFPDGKKKCKVGVTELKNNPGFVYRGYQNQVGFRFTYLYGAGAAR